MVTLGRRWQKIDNFKAAVAAVVTRYFPKVRICNKGFGRKALVKR